MTLATFVILSMLQCSVLSSQDAAKLTVNFVPPTEVNAEHQYKRYDNFPVPKLENVYHAWKPVDHGHPLRDQETLFYAPPHMERVRFQHETVGGPQSRSIDDEVFQHNNSPSKPPPAIVIPAEPKKEPQNHGYSVYGSPDINYSALYSSNQPVKLPTHDKPRPDGRENPYLAFQRDYQNSALDSRSADTRDYPLLWGNYAKQEESALEPVSSHGGGLQMIKPPNKKKKKPTEYFYYSDNSQYYKEKLSKKPNKEPHEEGNEIVSIDGIIVGTKNSLKSQQEHKRKDAYPEDLVPQASVLRPSVATTVAPSKANAVVYSFKNNFGQREHVGVIFDENDAPGPQVSKVLSSNKNQVLHQQQQQPIRHDRGHQVYGDPQGASSPDNALANFIPLAEKRPVVEQVKSQEQSFPLGNPFLSPLLKARPEYFPPLQYPPLFKTKPSKLEGSFGPALPPKPEPDVILFPDEELPGVVREHYHSRQTYQADRRHDAVFPGPTPPHQNVDVPVKVRGRESDNFVYKTVRDMDYSRPKDILSVKPSGELYYPEPGTQQAPLGDAEPRLPILPGIATIEQWQSIQTTENPNEADDRLWLPDFSDVLQQQNQHHQSPDVDHQRGKVPTLSEIFGTGGGQPLDLDTGSSVTDQVVFKENNYKRPGSSFKFPEDTGKRPQREIVQKPTQVADFSRKPSGAVKVQRVEPNYKVVIGLTYDDAGPDQVVKDYDTDFEEIQTDSKPFGKQQLYEICIEEVPKHLHRELCGYIRDGKIPPGREPAKSIQPRPSKLIQGPEPLSGQFINNGYEVTNYNPFAGIPTELPKQISKTSPMVITSNSRVKIYKPFEEKPVPITVKPVTTTSTSTTTTPMTSTTVQHLQTQRTDSRRPLLFNKRDPNTGESNLSKPFEYLNRLTQYFSNRVSSQSSGNHYQRQRLPPPPRLQRHRLRPPPQQQLPLHAPTT